MMLIREKTMFEQKMECSSITLNDLPTEILMIILKKLDNFDVLYSLKGVNQRLNDIVHQSIFATHLSFVQWVSHCFVDLILSDQIFNRFSLQILPEISENVRWINLYSSRVKDVLCAANYPNLFGLGLYHLNQNSLRSIFTDEVLSSGIFPKQIRTLVLTFDHENEDLDEIFSLTTYLCNELFHVFTGLVTLIFSEFSYRNRFRLSLEGQLLDHFSSRTLRKLHINVQTFNDCLYLLDGRFNQLEQLNLHMISIRRPQEIRNEGHLPNLKRFSLSCRYMTCDYDEAIPPLICRMSNLEKLHLCLIVVVDHRRFIDGNTLKRDILSRLTKLNHLKFSIDSLIFGEDQINLLTTEDIQQTFIGFPKNSVVSYVDYFPGERDGRCHIYSNPHSMEYYNWINNQFRGGIFPYVRVVSLRDHKPFEPEFFLRIQKSFPFLEELAIRNDQPQKNDGYSQSTNDQRDQFPIKYPRLHELCLSRAHDHYIKQFLFDTKTSFENNFILHAKYESLQRVTQNFTSDHTRINSKKITQLHIGVGDHYSNCIQEYFLCARIHC